MGSDAYPHCLIEAFAQALLHAEVVPLHLAERTDLGFAARFAIHRNNVRGARTEVLRQGFPVLERLLGQEYFTALAGVFIQRHPPCSAALHEYGGEMAEFIEAFAPVAQLGYLADMARLEWARLCAFHAADAPVPDLSAEALPALARLLDAPLRWHPSVTLLQQGGRLTSGTLSCKRASADWPVCCSGRFFGCWSKAFPGPEERGRASIARMTGRAPILSFPCLWERLCTSLVL